MREQFAGEKRTGLDEIVGKFLTNWYLFPIGLLLTGTLAFLYISYAAKEYEITSKVLIQSQDAQGGGDTEVQLANELPTQSSFKNNITNELQLLMSRSVIGEVVNKYQLNVIVSGESGFTYKELYKESPFDIEVKYKVDSVKLREYDITVEGQNMAYISNEDEGIEKELYFGKVIHMPQYDLVIRKKPSAIIGAGGYRLKISSIDQAIASIMGSYEAVLSEKGATTIDLTLQYPHPGKGEVILQEIMNEYLKTNLENKIRIADSTLTFIDNRLALVEKDLGNVEAGLQQYTSSNTITDIAEQSRVLVGDASDYTKRIQDQEIQLSIIRDLESYLDNPSSKRVIPSSLSIQNASFSASLQRYNDLLLDYERQSLSYTDSNPVIQNLNKQIQETRYNLLQNIKAYKKEMELSYKQLGSQNASINSQIQKMPEKERVFSGYSRQKDLQEQLYLYLLQKREEAAVSKTSTILNERILEPAKSAGSPFKPNKPIIYFIAFVMGIIIPTSFITARGQFNFRVATKADVEEVTDIPIIGEISHNTSKKGLLMEKNIRSLTAESFRTLRTNLQYELDLNKSNVIMLTSNTVGEGKTFLSGNIGVTLALTGKKVVLVELDLRKPQLSALMGIDGMDTGFSSYVVDDANIEDIIRPVTTHDHVYIVSSGPLQPNPSELLMDDKLDSMMEYLKANFDYVVIDSSPVGLVSDSLLITKHVDMTLFVIRQNYTYKSQIEFINKLNKSNKVENLCLVVNDVDAKKGGYYGYGNSYSYDPGYIEPTVKQSFWSPKRIWG